MKKDTQKLPTVTAKDTPYTHQDKKGKDNFQICMNFSTLEDLFLSGQFLSHDLNPFIPYQ